MLNTIKTILCIILVATAFISCKDNKKTEDHKTPIAKEAQKNDGLTVLKGEFVYYDDAAVLQTQNEIYGVLLTNKFNELSKRAEAYKTQPTDHVKVEIRGKITNEKHDKILWNNKVEVVEILNIQPGSKEDTNIIKLGNESI